ncbi:MAG: hypothetical protein AAF581_09220 [Planctomycetota bacterium]
MTWVVSQVPQPLIAIVIAMIVCPTATMAQFDDRYQLSLDASVAAPGDTVSVSVSYDAVNATQGSPLDLLGWSYGVCSDATLVTVAGVVDGFTSATVSHGGPPAFNAIDISPNPGTGFTVGVVVDFATATLSPGTGYELNVATYDLNPAVQNATASLDFCDTLSTPTVQTLVVELGGAPVVPVQTSGSIAITSLAATEFIRADVDGNGGVNLVDAILLAQALFQTGTPLACEAAGDVDDNGILDPLPDLLALLAYLFQGGSPPPPPFPSCGLAATPHMLACGSSGCP